MIIDEKFPYINKVKIIDLAGNVLGPFLLYDTDNKYAIKILENGERKGYLLPYAKAFIDGKEVC